MEQREGNTRASREKDLSDPDASEHKKKSRNWFFTFNNPDKHDVTPKQMEYLLDTLSPKAYVFQKEAGKEGTPHFQGVVSVRNPIVMPKHLCEKIHWEYSRSLAAAIKYCMKEEGRLDGPWGMGVEIPRPRKVITVLRPWQEQVKEILDEEPDQRKIHWFWETTGNVGKTEMAKFICHHYNALYLSGKANDAKYTVAQYVKRKVLHAVVFDFTRSQEGFVSYEAVEAIQNGIFHSGKYESEMCWFDKPHVICFANWEPIRGKLSEDKWDVVNINEMEI